MRDAAQLETIKLFLATMAQEGVRHNDPNAELILQFDIQELLDGTDESGDYFLTFDSGRSAANAPPIVLCKGWCKKVVKKVKKFVKKHKKAIIIGAAVVVAVVAAVCRCGSSFNGSDRRCCRHCGSSRSRHL